MRVIAGLILLLAFAACSKQAAPTATPASPPAPAVAPSPALAEAALKTGVPSEALAKEGEELFTHNCATCHMADGNGVPFLQPAIKGSALLSNADPQYLLTLILRGSPSLGEGAKAFENDMPPLDQLSDAEIAALATYVRQRFAAVPVTKPVAPPEVAVARARPGMPQ